ncbi:hypothetical protein KKY_269 [Pelagibacterium halotolerans B2]|uniref:Uncharacterized protein n=1 Tax=Pelagibacterium halotolerans (strain DSM 22347 / JCM 15775 / CGMCC 1.7692 / B2) TaxID=1082931 RepID=G4R8M8_PELHB|nr:hypothetical protein KKY_269 [Pelagibacterium halotolerans B2]
MLSFQLFKLRKAQLQTFQVNTIKFVLCLSALKLLTKGPNFFGIPFKQRFV